MTGHHLRVKNSKVSRIFIQINIHQPSIIGLVNQTLQLVIRKYLMEQLPKAQKIFSESINYHVNEYIEASEKVSKQYLKQRYQATSKSSQNLTIMRELQRQIKVLEDVERMGMEDFGTSIEQVRRLKLQYIQTLEKYEQFQAESQIGGTVSNNSRMQRQQQNSMQQQQSGKKMMQGSSSMMGELSSAHLGQELDEQNLINNQQISKQNEQRHIYRSKLAKCCQKTQIVALKSLQICAIVFMGLALLKVFVI